MYNWDSKSHNFYRGYLYKKKETSFITPTSLSFLPLPLRHLNPHPPRTIPDTITHPSRNLPPPKSLINKPHAHHELLAIQPHIPSPVDQIPDLGQLIKRQPAPRPDIANDDVDHQFRGFGVGVEETPVTRPDGLVSLPLAGTDLVAPAFARALVVGVFFVAAAEGVFAVAAVVGAEVFVVGG